MADTSEDEDRDMQIVAESFRVVSDVAAWDSLMHAWEEKLARAGLGDNFLSGEQRLKKHYSVIRSLLDKVGVPVVDDPVERAVASVGEPAMVLSENFRVIAINPEGRDAFGIEQGQVAHLSWLSGAWHGQFRALVATPAGGRNIQHHIVQTEFNGGQGYAEVFPVMSPGIKTPFTAVRELTISWSENVAHVLVEAFGLTEAEVDTARQLYLSGDIAKVADLRGVNIRTARLQLSHIFAKTETRNQIELVRLLVLLGARLAARARGPSLAWTDPLGREKIIIRADGRKLAYTWMGDPDGTPALFVHGVVNGYLYPDAFEATLKAQRIKLYVLTRPGCGNSDADPHADPCLDLASAISDLCTALSLRNIVGAAIHAAVIPMSLLAASANNPFSAIVAFGRFLPYSAKLYARIPKPTRTLIWLAFNAPWSADVIGRHAWRAVVQNGVDWYIERAYREMPFDFSTTKNQEISALMRNACAFTFRQGHDIFFDDLRLRQTDIRVSLAKLKIPFHWVLGLEKVYASPQNQQGFYDQSDLDDVISISSLISLEIVPSSGELLPYQQPVLAAMRIANAANGKTANAQR